MRVIGLPLLDDFTCRHTDAKGQIQAWVREAQVADWKTPQDVKDRYSHASILRNNRVIFNIKGNDYRLCVRINYQAKIVRVERIGTHAEHDRWKF